MLEYVVTFVSIGIISFILAFSMIISKTSFWRNGFLLGSLTFFLNHLILIWGNRNSPNSSAYEDGIKSNVNSIERINNMLDWLCQKNEIVILYIILFALTVAFSFYISQQMIERGDLQ